MSTVKRKLYKGPYIEVDKAILRWRKARKELGLRANGKPDRVEPRNLDRDTDRAYQQKLRELLGED